MIELINPLSHPKWDELLLTTPGHSIFHSSAWARVLCDAYGYRPVYFASLGKGRFNALLPVMEVRSILTGLRGVSLPFSDQCDPLSDGKPSPEDVVRMALDHGRRAGWKSIEFRGAYGLGAGAAPSQSFHGHKMELSQDEDRILSGFRDSNRRNIRKAAKEGVTARVDRSWEAMRAFCRLNDLTRRGHGLPPQPLSFFRSLHGHVIARDHGFVVVAEHHGRPIAGAVFLHFGRGAVYKYGASDRAHQQLRANNLVMWEGIRQCRRLGCDTLSLGRTDPGHEGLLQFKRGWGAREEMIHYYKYDLQASAFVQERSWVNGWHNSLFRNLPLPLSRIVGALLYGHMG
jgi:hypothetical protein